VDSEADWKAWAPVDAPLGPAVRISCGDRRFACWRIGKDCYALCLCPGRPLYFGVEELADWMRCLQAGRVR